MKKRTIAITVVGVLAVAGAVAAVSAQGHRRGHGDTHSMFGDDETGHGLRGRFGGALTKDEFENRSRERFARLDRNSDGVIDTAEIEAALSRGMGGHKGRHASGPDGRMGQNLVRMFDTNRDGKITRDEARAEIMRRFAEIDLNSDGRIDDNDLPPMMRGRNVLAAGSEGGFGPMHGRRGGHGMQGLGLLRQADINKDGVVTSDEAQALADREHARFDRNADGTVDNADFDALAKDMTDFRVKRFAHSFGADKDGRVTREQFQAKAAERFARMDVNGDGTVARDERPGYGHGRRGGHGMRDGGMGGGMMGGHGTGPRGDAGPGQDRGGPPAETPPTKN